MDQRGVGSGERVGERVNVKSEAIKRVSLREEHCMKDIVEGIPQFR